MPGSPEPKMRPIRDLDPGLSNSLLIHQQDAIGGLKSDVRNLQSDVNHIRQDIRENRTEIQNGRRDTDIKIRWVLTLTIGSIIVPIVIALFNYLNS